MAFTACALGLSGSVFQVAQGRPDPASADGMRALMQKHGLAIRDCCSPLRFVNSEFQIELANNATRTTFKAKVDAVRGIKSLIDNFL